MGGLWLELTLEQVVLVLEQLDPGTQSAYSVLTFGARLLAWYVAWYHG